MSILNLGKIDGQEYKAIVTLPGWQADQVWQIDSRSPKELAKIATSSVWCYACITLRADAMAMIEWEIAPEANPDASLSDRAPEVRLLNEVNPEMNWNDLIRSLESDLNIYGTGYWEKIRGGGGGKPRGIMRLNPSTIQLDADSRGIKSFIQRLPGSQEYERRIERKDMIYFREYDPSNDLGGLSKLSVAMAAASAGINTSEYVAAFFRNYAVPPLVFSTDQPIADRSILEEMRDTWNRWFRRKENQHKVGWTTHGMKPNVIGYPTKDLALADLLNEVRRDICAVFRVPPALAGAWEAANYAASQEQVEFLYRNTLKPRCEYISGVLEAELLDEFRPGLKFRWMFERLEAMAEDQLTSAQRHYLLVTGNIEDARAAAEALDVEPADIPVAPAANQINFAPRPDTGRPGLRSNGHFHAELDQWQRWIKNRLKRGESLFGFHTEFIPEPLRSAIEGQLETVETPGEAAEILRAASAWQGYP